jgi:hypothetical protein
MLPVGEEPLLASQSQSPELPPLFFLKRSLILTKIQVQLVKSQIYQTL